MGGEGELKEKEKAQVWGGRRAEGGARGGAEGGGRGGARSCAGEGDRQGADAEHDGPEGGSAPKNLKP